MPPRFAPHYICDSLDTAVATGVVCPFQGAYLGLEVGAIVSAIAVFTPVVNRLTDFVSATAEDVLNLHILLGNLLDSDASHREPAG